MKIDSPFPINTISQKFGANAVSYYAKNGLKGHTGIDYQVPWGTRIQASIYSYCYSVLSKDSPNLMAYRAVFTLVEDGDITWEISYGHCSEMYAIPGKYILPSETIAKVGNTGQVYANGVIVTKEEKDSGSKAASHLHFQIRKLFRVHANGVLDPKKNWANNGYGLLTANGYNYYWEQNGYNGCVDPAQFFSSNDSKEIESIIRVEIEVLKKTTDASVYKILLQSIIKYTKKLLGISM